MGMGWVCLGASRERAPHSAKTNQLAIIIKVLAECKPAKRHVFGIHEEISLSASTTWG